MREDISNPRKLAAKADEIWQSSSARSVNAVSWVQGNWLSNRKFMHFMPEILTLFFFKICSLAGDFLLILEPLSQFFHRLLQLHQLLSLRRSSSPLVVLLNLVFVLVLYLYILVLDTSPGLSSQLLSPSLSLAPTFSIIMPCQSTQPELGFRSSPQFHLQLPLIHSAPINSRLSEKTGNSCRSTQTFSLQTVFQPLHLNMEFSTTCPKSLVLQFFQSPPIGSWEAGLCQGRVSQDGESRYCSMFFFPVVQSSPHGP